MKLGDIVKPSEKWIEKHGHAGTNWMECYYLDSYYREKCFGIIVAGITGFSVTWFNPCKIPNGTPKGAWWEEDELVLVKEAQYDEYIFDRD